MVVTAACCTGHGELNAGMGVLVCAELLTWVLGEPISKDQAMRCAKREPGRSWEAIDSELKKLGARGAVAPRSLPGRSLPTRLSAVCGQTDARPWSLGSITRHNVSFSKHLGDKDLSFTEIGRVMGHPGCELHPSLSPALPCHCAGAHPATWPLPLSRDGLAKAAQEPLPQPMPATAGTKRAADDSKAGQVRAGARPHPRAALVLRVASLWLARDACRCGCHFWRGPTRNGGCRGGAAPAVSHWAFQSMRRVQGVCSQLMHGHALLSGGL